MLNEYHDKHRVQGDQPAADIKTNRTTTLIAYYAINKEGRTNPTNANAVFARTLKYVEMPRHFTFAAGKWKRRTKISIGSFAVGYGRMHAVPPGDNERYYMRMLLDTVIGAESDNDLKTRESRFCSVSYTIFFRQRCTVSDVPQCVRRLRSDGRRQRLRQVHGRIVRVSQGPGIETRIRHGANALRCGGASETARSTHRCECFKYKHSLKMTLQRLAEDFIVRARRADPTAELDDAMQQRVLASLQRSVMFHGHTLPDYGIAYDGDAADDA